MIYTPTYFSVEKKKFLTWFTKPFWFIFNQWFHVTTYYKVSNLHMLLYNRYVDNYCWPSKGQKPIIFISTIFVHTCSETYLYTHKKEIRVRWIILFDLVQLRFIWYFPIRTFNIGDLVGDFLFDQFLHVNF